MIAGRQYFPGKGPDENIRFLEMIDVEPPGVKSLIRRLWGIVPAEDRYTDYAEVLADLEKIPQSGDRKSRKVRSVFDLVENPVEQQPSADRALGEKPKKKVEEKNEPVPMNPFQRALVALILAILAIAGWFLYHTYFS
jgi:hypothetical protein